MSDLYLTHSAEGADIEILATSAPRTTNALEVAVYLSLFTPQTWQDMTRQAGTRYTSTLPDLFASSVSNATRLAIIAAAENALEWMLTDGIAASVEVNATIETARSMTLSIIITEPDSRIVYGLNWDAQAAELMEAT